MPKPTHPLSSLLDRLDRGARPRKRALAIVAVVALVPAVALASQVEIPNVFSSGETITAQSFNENFQALADAINDNDARLADLEAGTGGGGGADVPADGVMFFDSDVCPDGWSELVAARGRTIVALPFGGTMGATVGTELEDEGTRTINQVVSHTHGSGSIAATISSAGSHTHTTQSAGSHNHTMGSAGSHTHTIDNGGSHTHSLWLEVFGSYGTWGVSGVVNSAGGNVSSSPVTTSGNHTHTMQSAGSHAHGINNGGSHSHAVNSSGSHTHDATVNGTTSATGGPTVDVTMPYIQLLVCVKD